MVLESQIAFTGVLHYADRFESQIAPPAVINSLNLQYLGVA